MQQSSQKRIYIDLTEDAPLTPSKSQKANNDSTQPSLSSRRKADSSIDSLDVRPTKKLKRKHADGRDPSNDSEKPYVIAQSEEVQATTGLSSGVLFEIARLITLDTSTYDRLTPTTLQKLKGSNFQSASMTARTLLPSTPAHVPSTIDDPAFAPEVAATSPWEELDREEDFLSKSKYAGVGNSDIAPNWYGGKVIFRGRLESIHHSFIIKLERPALGPSCRFARRFGSGNFLRIKVPDRILHSGSSTLSNFFKKPFILWGDVFRSFYAKDGTVFMVKTNEAMAEGVVHPSLGLKDRLSLREFLDWHNPLSFNTHQAMAKWAARTALGLSNSVPGPVINSEDILHEDDIVSNESSEMTDGCGLANMATTLAVSRIIGPETYSVAFQFRLAGAKGMLVEKPDTASREACRVWIRPSQLKIKYSTTYQSLDDPTFRTIDLLRVTYMRSPTIIAPEVIINLAENGVPHTYFKNLLTNTISELVNGLTNWDDPFAMYSLWKHVERNGSVLASRRAREAVGESRFRGYGGYSYEVDESSDEDALDIQNLERSTAWWSDQISGCPSSLEETVMVLLDSGFHPSTCPVLGARLKGVIASRIKNTTRKYRYEVPNSAVAFAIPDHTGLLGPDEIHFRSSRRNLKTSDEFLTDLLLGDVVMLRYPCKLPTDARKVRAVEHPQLRNYVDVVVCSVQGARRLLDFLAGGDYDGDTVTVIWAPEVVNNFTNADEKFSREPTGLNFCFESAGNETAADFVQRSASLTEVEQMHETQSYLLGSLRNPSIVGRYSVMHGNSVYERGYSHPKTIRLAYKFCKVLDSAKTGLRIKNDTLRYDIHKYNKTRGPQWEVATKTKENTFGSSENMPLTPRGRDSRFIRGEFIMDFLYRSAKKECDRVLGELDALFAKVDKQPDPHLTQPWWRALEMASWGTGEVSRAKENDLKKIKAHVQEMYRKHQSYHQVEFTSQAIEKRQDVLRALSKSFNASPSLDEMESFTDAASISRIRASYAYVYDCEQKARGSGWSRFPWNVALRDLCQIKAAAVGTSKTVTQGFYERFKLARI